MLTFYLTSVLGLYLPEHPMLLLLLLYGTVVVVAVVTVVVVVVDVVGTVSPFRKTSHQLFQIIDVCTISELEIIAIVLK